MMSEAMSMENMAKDIYSWCKENGLWNGSIVYFDRKMLWN